MRDTQLRSHIRKGRAYAWLLVVMTTVMAAACDSGQSEITGNGGDPSGLPPWPPPNPLGNRENPLQTHIRSHWTGGDPALTGGVFRGHIKIYGQSYTHFENVADPEAQAQFVADNYDIYMGGGTIVGDYMSGTTSINLYEPTTVHIVARWDSIRIQNWLDNPALNREGYLFDDVVMHYKWDVSTWYADTPGWNPDDDLDGDLCRDVPPSEPDRTAVCIQDAEVRQPDYFNPGRFLRRARIMHPAVIGASVLSLVDRWGHHGIGGFHFDAVAYENWRLELAKTFTYEGFDESDPNHPMRTDLLLFVPTVVKEAEKELGVPVIHFGNTVAPRYTCAIPESGELALRYLENTLNENWIDTGISGVKPMATDRRADYLDCPYSEWLEHGKGYVFSAFNRPPTDRGKRFSLALFYMINHQMAFYYYRTDGHSIWPEEYVWDKQFNNYVDYDIGQPAINSLGHPDFQGNTGTNRYFVMETATGYEILGRQYRRADGTRILVLVKLMDRDRVEGADPAPFQLPGAYHPVLPDLTLGAAVTAIELVNNDGVILVESP
jgi:hypothetical protein